MSSDKDERGLVGRKSLLPKPYMRVPRPPRIADIRAETGKVRLTAEDYAPHVETVRLMLEINPKLTAAQLVEVWGDPDLYSSKASILLREARRLERATWELGRRDQLREEMFESSREVMDMCLDRMREGRVLPSEAETGGDDGADGPEWLSPKELASLGSTALKANARCSALMGLDRKVEATPEVSVTVANQTTISKTVITAEAVVEKYDITIEALEAAGDVLADALTETARAKQKPGK